MSCSKPSPCFFLPIVLVQVDLNFSRPKSNQALFVACAEASVFALVKSSLDCRHVCLLESVLLLAGCCERVFLHHGEDSPIITTVVLRGRPGLSMFLSSPVRSSFLRMYQTVDLAPNAPALSLMDLFCFWSLTIICFSCMERSFDRMMWFTATASKCKSTFTCSWCRNNEGIAHICPWNSFWVNCPITYDPLKKGSFYPFLQLWWEYHQIKNQSVHFKHIWYALYNCNLNMF